MGEKDAKTEDPNPQEQRPELPPAGEDKKDTSAIILKLNLHCDGCAKKLKRSIRKNFEGVEEVMTDLENNKLTVKGKVDPANLLKKLEEKTRRKIELLSPLPTSAAGGGDRTADVKSEKNPEPNKEDEKPKEIVVVLKIRLHCEGCMHKIKRVIKKYDGVKYVDFEATKNLVKIVGVMDENLLASYLRDKLKRSVDVISLKKDIGENEVIGDKKNEEEKNVEKDTKEKEIGDNNTKITEKSDHGTVEEKETGNNNNKDTSGINNGPREEKPVEIEEEAKVEANKMEYYGQTHNSYYTMPPSIPINHVYMNHGYYGYGLPSDQSDGYNSNRVFVNYPHQGYHNEGYNLQQYPGPYGAFSDENPNASCYVM